MNIHDSALSKTEEEREQEVQAVIDEIDKKIEYLEREITRMIAEINQALASD